MQFRRGPVRYRRYNQFNPEMVLDEKINFESPKGIDNLDEISSIPNSLDSDYQNNRNKSPFNFIHNITKNIGMEEILIIGLIFLFFEEQIEDEILLIIFIYLLLTGND